MIIRFYCSSGVHQLAPASDSLTSEASSRVRGVIYFYGIYKMAKIIYFALAFLVAAAFLGEVSAAGECPLVSQVYSCNPSCLQDSDCSYGKKCCSNSCHTKSCVEGKTQGSSGYKGSSGGTGTYCNNVKCSAHEKCALDSSTKRMKCVRA